MRADMQVAAAVAEAHRREWAFVLAATVRVTRNIDLAEDCVQDAYAQALRNWSTTGVPDKPALWLSTVARRRAVDVLRRENTFRRALPLVIEDEVEPDPAGTVTAADDIPDDRLRLVFVCCHPTLSPEARVALTLRLVCGLTTVEVGRALLVSTSTMAARITRAKAKIEQARIPYVVPSTRELPERTAAVLDVLHLVFATGHTAPAGADLIRRDLMTRGLDMARMLAALLPDDPDVTGLLALLLLTDARSPARVSDDGRLQLLENQDRERWDRRAIDEGVRLVRRALRVRPPGRFALMAAIAAVHAESPSWIETDWAEIVGLYDLLLAAWPSPVVALNRAIAVGFLHGAERGLAELDALAAEPQLATYRYLAASRADMLRRLSRPAEARLAYEEALLMTDNEVERAFLEARLASL